MKEEYVYRKTTRMLSKTFHQNLCKTVDNRAVEKLGYGDTSIFVSARV